MENDNTPRGYYPAGKNATRYGNQGSFINMAERDKQAAVENATREIGEIMAEPKHELHPFLDEAHAGSDPVAALQNAKTKLALDKARKARVQEQEKERLAEEERQNAEGRRVFAEYLETLRKLPFSDTQKVIPGKYTTTEGFEFEQAVVDKLADETAYALKGGNLEILPKPTPINLEQTADTPAPAIDSRTAQALGYAKARWMKGEDFTAPMQAALDSLPEAKRNELFAEWAKEKAEAANQ